MRIAQSAKRTINLILLFGMTLLFVSPTVVGAIEVYKPPDSGADQNLLYYVGSGDPEAETKCGGCWCYGGFLNSVFFNVYDYTGVGNADPNDMGRVCAAIEKAKQDPVGSGDVVDLSPVTQTGEPSITETTITMIDRILEERPASGVLAIEETLNRIVDPSIAYAQSPEAYFPGTGFQMLAPVQAFWGWAVTVSMGFMIIVIIVIAFALLFRARLDGGQVIQIQNAIPNIVLAFILIPLSYSITGLFIDGLTLGSNIIHSSFFGPTGIATDVYSEGSFANNEIFTYGIEQVDFDDPEARGLHADDIRITPFNIRAGFISNLDFSEIFSATQTDTCTVSTGACEKWVDSGNPLYALTNDILGASNQASSFLQPFILALLSIITFITALRIFWKLLKRYLMMLFYPVMSPFIFLTIAIPGQGTKTIVLYLKVMASVVLTFLVTYIMFLVSVVLANELFVNRLLGDAAISGISYSPPLLGLATEISSDGGESINVAINNRFIFSLISAGVYLSIPGTIDMIVKALGVDQPLPEIIKRPLNELQIGSRAAFRQIPGAAYVGAKRTYGAASKGVSGVRAGLGTAVSGIATNRVNPNDPFSKTFAQRQSKRTEDELNKTRAEIESRSGLNPTKYFARASFAGRRARANFVQGVLSGEEKNYASGELQGMKYKLSIDVPDFEPRGGGFKLKAATAAGRSVIPGQLTAERASDDGPELTGKLWLTSGAKGGRTKIGTLKTANSTFSGYSIDIFASDGQPSLTSDKKKSIGIEFVLNAPSGGGFASVKNVTFSTSTGGSKIDTKLVAPNNQITGADLNVSLYIE